MFIRKRTFDRLGGFDENIFMYFEDADFCERARALGNKIIYFPDFVVKHLGGASFENKKIQKKYYYISQEYFFKKHCQKWEVIALRLIRKLFYAL
jgi:GT2 family glycosyltransferase